MTARRALMLLALLGEGGSGWLLLNAPVLSPELLASLTLHGGASALFGWTLIGAAGAGQNRSWALLASTVALLAFPLFGMVAMTIGFAASAALTRGPARPAAAEAGDPLFETEELLARAEARRIDLISELEIEPFVDVLRERDLELKRGAIDALVRSAKQQAVGVLRTLLNDPHPEVRLYASVTLSKLEDDISQAILAARAEVVELSARGRPDSAAHERLASLYLDYAISGFLDEATQGYYLEMARREYEATLAMRPGDSKLELALGRVYLMRGNPAGARTHLENAVLADPTNLEAQLALLELAYRVGAFAELVERARVVQQLLPDAHPQRPLVEWWAREANEQVS